MFKIVFIFIANLIIVCADPFGATTRSCYDMIPRHFVEPLDASFPFKITINPTKVNPGDIVKITLNSKVFRGFLIQVRKQDTPVGVFEIAHDDKHSKTIACHGTKNVLSFVFK